MTEERQYKTIEEFKLLLKKNNISFDELANKYFQLENDYIEMAAIAQDMCDENDRVNENMTMTFFVDCVRRDK